MAEDSVAPDTTTQQDLVSAGQRRVNIIWEVTQSVIAVSITFANIYCSVFKIDSTALTNAFFLIVGFYFSRTNHSAIGGIGPKITGPYLGR